MGKILTAYFSLKGQTIAPGMKIVNVDKGNTAYVAEFINQAIGGDIFEIQTVKTYNPDHMKMIYEARDELSAGARPELKDCLPGIEGYDTIFLCYPNWWATLPMPVVSFLEKFSWNGKRIIAVCTSEGSGFSHSVDDLKSYCQGASVEQGLHIIGSQASASRKVVQDWAQSVIRAGI